MNYEKDAVTGKDAMPEYSGGSFLSSLRLIPSRSGALTIKYCPEGGEIWLHSPYDPVREARRWVENITPEDGSVMAVLGFGLGYHIAALAQKFPERKILVLEPLAELFTLARNQLNLRELLAEPHLHVFTGLDRDRLLEFLMRYINPAAGEKVQLLEYSPLVRVFQEQYQCLSRRLVDALNSLQLTFNTIRFFSAQWTENFFANLPDIINSPGVNDLFGAFAGRPGVIVSAGPSLDKNVHLLREAAGRGLIIAVGTALKPVLKTGVEPDLVVSADGGEPNYRHFLGVQVKRAALVYHPLIYPKIVAEHQGPRLTMDGDGFFGGWLENVTGQSKGAVKVGPSVANVAFDLAVKLGLNPIVLIGQDLAYTNGLSHARGTMYQDVRPLEETGRHFTEVEDVFGGKVLTDRVLNSMRDWFNREIARLSAEKTVINATEGGAKIEGTRIMSFSEALEQYFTEEFDAREIIQNASKRFKPLPIKKQKGIGQNLNKVKKRLRKIDYLCVKGIKYAEKLEKSYERPLLENEEISLILRKLDRIDRQLKEYKDDATLLNLIFQPVAHSLSQSFKAGPGETEQEEGRRLARKSRFLYLGIKDAARRLCEILEPVVENLGIAREKEEKTIAKSLPELPAEEHSNGFAG